MSALQAFVEQIETYGIPYSQYAPQDSSNLVRIFIMDDHTVGVIVYNSYGSPIEAKFIPSKIQLG